MSKDLDFIDNFFMDEEDIKQLSQKAKEKPNTYGRALSNL